MARPRTGELIWRKASGTWSARYYDSAGRRRGVSLGTDNAAVARQKLARIVAGDLDPAAATPTESFQEAAERIIATSETDRLRRLKAFACPVLGPLSIERIGRSHVREALKAAVRAEASHGSVLKLRNDISAVLSELCADDVIPTNPALQLKCPRVRKTSGPGWCSRTTSSSASRARARTPSCWCWRSSAAASEACAPATCTHGTGGISTWTAGKRRTCRGPKAKSSERHALPADVVPTLQGWWRREGKPRTGPVFPVRVGKRAGERKQGKISYADRLRAELLRAGLDRHDLHHDTEHTRRVDFHSCRRAYATGLATAGVNVQTAMRLAGHRNPSTHQRYVVRAEIVATPAAALPSFKAPPVPIDSMPAKRRSRKPSSPLASPARVELATNALGKRCSIQLSYGDLAGRGQRVARLAQNENVSGRGFEKTGGSVCGSELAWPGGLSGAPAGLGWGWRHGPHGWPTWARGTSVFRGMAGRAVGASAGSCRCGVGRRRVAMAWGVRATGKLFVAAAAR